MATPDILKHAKGHIYLLIITGFAYLIGILLVIIGSYALSSRTASTILVGIGTSVVASGVVMTLEFFRSATSASYLKRVVSVLHDAGVYNVYSKRDLDEYDLLMDKCADVIDITGYSLNAWLDSYGELLEGKFAGGSNVKLRILCVHPHSLYAANREEIEGKARGIFADSLKRVHVKLCKYANCEMRLLNAPLSTMYFRIDDIIYVGPHLYGKSSKSSFTIRLAPSGWAGSQYRDEFERLWNNGDTWR